jgi:hypothetical protein
MNHPGGADQLGRPVDRPGSEQRQDVGIIHNRQPDETRKDAVDRGKDTFQRDRSTTMQNRPSGVIENINPGGNTVKQQNDRGRPSQNVPAQKPVQTIQGDKIGQSGVGGVPNVSGGDRSPGSVGVIPGGGGIPNIGGAGHGGGGGLPSGGGQDGFRRQQ